MFQKIFFTFVMSFLCFGVVAQEYEKKRGTIRLLTYNTHYCKGAADPGTISEENLHNLARIIKALDADIVALQELDSASLHRGGRYLLKDIADATGSEYTPVYGNAASFDHGSIGCGVLVRKKRSVKNIEVIPLPGDEARVAVKIKFKNFVFIGTHSDLNDEKRKEGAVTVCDLVKDETKPVFLAGDLNDSHRWPKGGISFPVWMKQFKIISDTIGNSIPGRTDGGALIDYVLLLDNKKASKVKVGQSYIVRSLSIDGKKVDTSAVSDHYPVFVDVKL